MKVTDNLLVQNCFRQGEVARLSLEKKRKANILVSEAELKDIQPKKNNTGRLIDPRKEGRAGFQSEVLGHVFSNFSLTFGYFLANFERLVLGCIEAEFCK